MKEHEFELAVLKRLLEVLRDPGCPVRCRERKVAIVEEMLAAK